MKKHRAINYKKRWIAIGVIIFILAAYFYANPPKWIYYAIEANYIQVTGTVNFINSQGGNIYFGCCDLSPNLSDTCFKLTGANAREAVNNGVWQKLNYGAKVEIVIPKLYYGDGYVYPVAAIQIDGEEFLSFDVGLANMRSGDYK